MAVGHRLDSFHAAWRARAGVILLLARSPCRNSPLFTKAASTAVSPVCAAASGRRPWHPGPTTAFPVRGRARREPCRLAHGAACDESSQGQQSTPPTTTPGHLSPATPLSSAPVAKLAFALRDAEKAHRQSCHSHRTGAAPHDSLARHGRFREITFPDKLTQLLKVVKFKLEIISGVGGARPSAASLHPVHQKPDRRRLHFLIRCIPYYGAKSRRAATCARGAFQTVRRAVKLQTMPSAPLTGQPYSAMRCVSFTLLSRHGQQCGAAGCARRQSEGGHETNS
ncbi:hypothetical protein C7974DRAFT_379975 [Boeremia exigua]|uniref:uncharacterized protein n=1 Tax=Boeremia exigua TaxID=749465 RepID=UPI001E8CCF0B|nr:uncharacterized protein C7974DRAFT_379975 [Boeremia exigua]KAH6615101.1 hypothetical protein C7974DRAFT_379975 [Boeremia exigua]